MSSLDGWLRSQELMIYKRHSCTWIDVFSKIWKSCIRLKFETDWSNLEYIFSIYKKLQNKDFDFMPQTIHAIIIRFRRKATNYHHRQFRNINAGWSGTIVYFWSNYTSSSGWKLYNLFKYHFYNYLRLKLSSLVKTLWISHHR